MRIPTHLASLINSELVRVHRCELFTEQVAAWLYTWYGTLDALCEAELRAGIRRAVDAIDYAPQTSRRLVATF